VREEVGVGGRRKWQGSVAEVETGTLDGRRDDRQRADPEILELRRGPSQLDELAPAERSVQDAQEHQEDRAPATVIGQRHVPLSMDGRERKVWCWFARLYGCSSHGAHASLRMVQQFGLRRGSRSTISRICRKRVHVKWLSAGSRMRK